MRFRPILTAATSLLLTVALALCLPQSAQGASSKGGNEKKAKKKVDKIFYYKFNENGGWRTYDLTHSYLHAELFQVTWKKDETRRVVAHFDGEKSWARIPPTDRFEIEKVTFTAWIRPEALVDGAAIFSNRGNKDGFAIGLTKTGAVFFSPNKDTMHKSAGTVKPGVWSLIIVVYNEAKVNFYINGTPAGEVECKEEIPFHNTPAAIGVLNVDKGHEPGIPRYKGDISEMRMLGQSVPARAAAALYKMTKTVDKPKVLLVPYDGGVGMDLPAELVEKACEKAKELKVDVILLDIDTPGGAVAHLKRIQAALLDLTNIQTVSYVSGRRLINKTDDKGKEVLMNGAFSAGSYTCLATHRVVMKSDTSIGASSVINGHGQKILAKFRSAIVSQLRANAMKAGHDPELVQGMAEEARGLMMARVYGNPRYGSKLQMDQLLSKYKDHCKVAATLAAPGEIVCLTGKRALEVGAIFATASTLEKCLKRLGIEDAEIIPFKDEAEKIVAEYKEKFKADQEARKDVMNMRQTIGGVVQKAYSSRPDNQAHITKYNLNAHTGAIANRSAWKKQCKECEKATAEAIDALKKIKDMHEAHPDWKIDEYFLQTGLGMARINQELEKLEGVRKWVKSRKTRNTKVFLRFD